MQSGPEQSPLSQKLALLRENNSHLQDEDYVNLQKQIIDIYYPSNFEALKKLLPELLALPDNVLSKLLQATVLDNPDRAISLLWHVACVAPQEILMPFIQRIASFKDDALCKCLQISPQEGTHKGISVLWFIASMAHQRPDGLNLLLPRLLKLSDDQLFALLQAFTVNNVNEAMSPLRVISGISNLQSNAFNFILQRLLKCKNHHKSELLQLLTTCAERGPHQATSVRWQIFYRFWRSETEASIIHELIHKLPELFSDPKSLIDSPRDDLKSVNQFLQESGLNGQRLSKLMVTIREYLAVLQNFDKSESFTNIDFNELLKITNAARKNGYVDACFVLAEFLYRRNFLWHSIQPYAKVSNESYQYSEAKQRLASLAEHYFGKAMSNRLTFTVIEYTNTLKIALECAFNSTDEIRKEFIGRVAVAYITDMDDEQENVNYEKMGYELLTEVDIAFIIDADSALYVFKQIKDKRATDKKFNDLDVQLATLRETVNALQTQNSTILARLNFPGPEVSPLLLSSGAMASSNKRERPDIPEVTNRPEHAKRPAPR